MDTLLDPAAPVDGPLIAAGKASAAEPAIPTARGMDYTRFIAKLCVQREARTYLEVGVNTGANLSQVVVDTAFGVDPAFALTVDPTPGKRLLSLHRATSDAFFRDCAAQVREAGGLDLSFLDGMHLFEYLLRDIYNAEALSNRGGLIALHDCLPLDGEMVERVNNFAGRTPGPYAGAWTGDVWKVVRILEEYRPDLKIVLLDCYPTGLVCLTGLDPQSTVLRDRYLEIVDRFQNEPNDTAALQAFYAGRTLVAAASVLADFNQSLHFKV